jgi:stearoyl-CoA desaturase (Delta-9 desaturase)
MFSPSINVPVPNKPPLIPVNAAVFIGLPLIALLAIPYWGFTQGYDAFQWLWALAFLYLNGIGITGGYHRLWAHRAYEASVPLRFFYALWGAGALQNSILVWASDHRRHHRHVDDDERDPYSAGRGLWFSHMGWILREYRPQVNDFSNVPDLLRDPIVCWQHRHYVAITTFMNLGLPILLGWWHGDIIGCVLLIGLGRLIVNHHVTFFINSLAHFWGKQPYTDENSARDNGFLAFLTYGEGYHNFHHLFQNDYRNGVRWWQWDPTKWFISLCSALGLARRLQRIPPFKIQRAILAQKFRVADRSLANSANAETLRTMLEREYQLFAQSVNEWKSLQTDRYQRGVAQLETALDQRKQKLQQKWQHAALRMRLQELEYSLKMQRKRLELLILQASSSST